MKKTPAVVKLLEKRYPFSSIALGVIFYIIGLGISFALDVGLFFLQNWLFAMGCIILSINTSMLIWAFKSLSNVVEELKSSFEITGSEFGKIERDFRRLASGNKFALLPLIISVGFAIFGYLQVSSRSVTLFIVLPQFPYGSFPLSAYSLVLFSFSWILNRLRICMFSKFFKKSS